MPTISINRDLLFQELGATYTVPEFEDLCFQFGIELDDVTSEKEEILKEKGEGAKIDEASEEIIYKIEIPANRYDLLCLEGLAASLRVFLGKQKPPVYKVEPPVHKMILHPEVKQIRQFVVAAVLRNITFNNAIYKSFIDLQDKLHHNICRQRTLVSIGTHDLDTINAPFHYKALAPKSINFTPLNRSNSFDGEQLMVELEKDLHLGRFLHIIKNSPVYPVIYDDADRVLSLPPIINGDHSKITLNTKNVLIEVTATDFTKAKIVLDTMCAMFSGYCNPPYQIEQVEVVDGDTSIILPTMENRSFNASLSYMNSSLGLKLSSEEVCSYLNKMLLIASPTNDSDVLQVLAPPTRSDILHQCDIMEDMAIAYGYNNLDITPPKTLTYGIQQPLNLLSDLLRYELAFAGYTEVLSFALCSYKENFKFLQRPDDGSAVVIANPKTIDFEVARTTLLVGLLKTLSSSKNLPVPIKVFEVSDVVLRKGDSEVGAINERHLAAVYTNVVTGFEYVHGLLDQIMLKLGVDRERYYLDSEGCSDPAFFPGMRANVVVDSKVVGVIGAFHPIVIENFELNYPCSAVELNIEHFL